MQKDRKFQKNMPIPLVSIKNSASTKPLNQNRSEIGDIAYLLEVLRGILKDCGASPQEILLMATRICEPLGIDLKIKTTPQESLIRPRDISKDYTFGYVDCKMETFPPEFMKKVDEMLTPMLEEHTLNCSAIARFCTANGHPISAPAVKRYVNRKLGKA